MSYVNATQAVKVYINDVEVSEYLIQGSISDDSAYTASIITSRGQIVLGGTRDIFDLKQKKYPVGSIVDVWVKLRNGKVTKHPKGRLYVINTSTNIEDKTLTLDVGCSLAFLSERQEQYGQKIQDLWSLMSANDRKSFKIDQSDMSSLSNYLKAVGKIIFQDKYGFIQTLNAFSGVGIGSTSLTPKLISFDTDTAISVESISDSSIEPDVDAITIESTIDVPVLTPEEEDDPDQCNIDSDCPTGYICDEGVCVEGCTVDSDCGPGEICVNGKCTPEEEEEEDDPDEPTIPVPEPLISSITQRTTPTPAVTGQIVFGEGTENTLTGQTNPIVPQGTTENPVRNWDGTIGHNYQVTGQIEIVDNNISERVTSGKYVEYKGPGNQVSFEQNWEHSSAATWGSSAIRNTITELVAEINKIVEEINSMLQKTNQLFDKRDEYDEGSVKWDQFHVKGMSFYSTAQDYFSAAESIIFAVNSIAKSNREKYNLATMTETSYKYGAAGQVKSKRTRSYVQEASLQNAKTHRVRKYWTTHTGNGAEEGASVGFRITWSNLEIIEARPVPRGKIRIGSFYFQYPLILASESLTTYEYSNQWTTERIEFTDFVNPENNYVTENYSSSQSANPLAPDRIEAEITGDDALFIEEDDIDDGTPPTPDEGEAPEEEEDLCPSTTVAFPMNTTLELSGSGTNNFDTTWFGTPEKYVKVESMPLEFAPLYLAKNSYGRCVATNFTSRLNRYQNYVKKYAIVLANKISGDNKGFRVSESLRAEVFAYHPFYPIQINLSTAELALNTLSASSTWVFDQSNALCSFDCFTYSTKDLKKFSKPSVYSCALKTEGNKTLTATNLKLPSNCVSIKIEELPDSADGEIQLVGSPVSVGDIITRIQIDSGNLVFVPVSSSETTSIDFTFKVIKADGEELNILDLLPGDLEDDVTAADYKADAGDFDNATTNGGTPAGGGNHDTGTAAGGFPIFNAGNFDTGAEVPLPQPVFPSNASGENGDTDYDDEGTSLVDDDGNTIDIGDLPSGEGDTEGGFDVVINANFITGIESIMTAKIVLTEGFDYGYALDPFGFEIDFGSIATPNTFNGNLGTIDTPVEPVIASSVT